MVKDFLEDYARQGSDKAENNQLSTLNDGQQKKSGSLGLGDLILVKENEQFPADIVIIKSSDEANLAFVETKNLDGETNLKSKIAC
jgi:P-type E1-E2 ATPase